MASQNMAPQKHIGQRDSFRMSFTSTMNSVPLSRKSMTNSGIVSTLSSRPTSLLQKACCRCFMAPTTVASYPWTHGRPSEYVSMFLRSTSRSFSSLTLILNVTCCRACQNSSWITPSPMTTTSFRSLYFSTGPSNASGLSNWKPMEARFCLPVFAAGSCSASSSRFSAKMPCSVGSRAQAVEAPAPWPSAMRLWVISSTSTCTPWMTPFFLAGPSPAAATIEAFFAGWIRGQALTKSVVK
mmetsp:Transcript_8938/g.26269  ORF Transcript_8938/g.26269 Transcript_8938/m.26269 type:complete len:240 (+) Transcript_8938:582-1301(+)